MNLYKVIDVWKKLDKTSVVRYRCFECLNSKQYCVQSADFYRLSFDQKLLSNLDAQFLELFTEQEPSSRNPEYPSLEETIAARDKLFT